MQVLDMELRQHLINELYAFLRRADAFPITHLKEMLRSADLEIYHIVRDVLYFHVNEEYWNEHVW